MKKRWTTTELTELRRRYPDETTEAIGNDLGQGSGFLDPKPKDDDLPPGITGRTVHRIKG